MVFILNPKQCKTNVTLTSERLTAIMSSELEKQTKEFVLNREKSRCILCRKIGVHVHEIVPRSRFGKLRAHILFDVKNRVCLCPACHSEAHNFDTRKHLLEILTARYNYTYIESEFERYFNK